MRCSVHSRASSVERYPVEGRAPGSAPAPAGRTSPSEVEVGAEADRRGASPPSVSLGDFLCVHVSNTNSKRPVTVPPTATAHRYKSLKMINTRVTLAAAPFVDDAPHAVEATRYQMLVRTLQELRTHARAHVACWW